MTTRSDLSAARQFLKRAFPAGGRVLCAVSGGLDSMCLLDFLLRQREFSVVAAHFNHCLRGENADRDEQFVRTACARRGVPFLAGRGDTRTVAAQEGLSLEEAARQLRYAFLRESAEKSGCAAILTAHHADDSAETMLLNLLRGTGSAGLSGIPAARDGIYRPFLEISRETLWAYAQENGVAHVEDETNQMDDATRNVLRHQILPVLRELNPRAVENMARAAAILSGENQALETLAKREAARAEKIPGGLRLPCAVLTQSPPAVAERTVLRLLAQTCGRRKDLTSAHVEAVLQLARSAAPGKTLSLPYGLTARRGRYTLYLERTQPPPEGVVLAAGQSVRFGRWLVKAEMAGAVPCGLKVRGELTCALRLPPEKTLSVTAWRGGDRMTLPGSHGARTLKRLFLDRGIAAPLRDGLPVLRVEDTAAAVPYVGTDETFTARPGEGTVLVQFILMEKDKGES